MNYSLILEAIEDYVESDSYRRGKAYWHSGRVGEIRREADKILGKVQGSQIRPYEVEIILDEEGIVESICSCPVGYACKHVAALALAAFSNQPTKLRKAADPGWADILNRAVTQTQNVQDVPSQNQLQLLLRLEEKYEYGPSFSKTQAPLWQLELRPQVYYPDRQRASMTVLQWKDCLYTYSMNKGILPPKQAWFLRQLTQALQMSDHFGDTRWLGVTARNAYAVWNVLNQREAQDVPLFFWGRWDRTVLLSQSPLVMAFTIRDGERDGGKGVWFERSLRLEGVPVDTPVLWFGNPPSFSVRLDESSYSLPSAPRFEIISLHSVENIPAAEPDFLSKPLFVPDREIPVFVNQFAPALVRHYEIDNQSTRVTLPRRVRPKAGVVVSKLGEQGIQVSTHWQYGDKKTPLFAPSDFLILDPSGRSLVKDERLENEIRVQVENAVGHLPHFWEGGGNGARPRLKEKVELHRMDAVRFLADVLPSLRAHPDIQVDCDSVIPAFKQDTSEPFAEFSVDERDEGGDWFDLNVSVVIGGERMTFDKVFTALANGEEHLFLSDGRYAALDHPFFERLRLLIRQAEHLRDEGKGTLTVNRFQAGWWEELRKLGIVRQEARRWKVVVEGLMSEKGVELLSQPAALKGMLRPYQLEGYSWMHFLRKKGLGGVLADDMGLGKTVQTIALILQAREKEKASGNSRPFLIVAPTSVVENWDMELERFAPHLKRVVMRRGDRSGAHRKASEADVVITSYALLGRDREHFAKSKWDTIVLDEAQFVKNHRSKAYSVIRQLKTNARIALTGTPLENNLMELWSIFSIAAPGLFPPSEKFKEIFQRPIEKEGQTGALTTLRACLKPFLLRRTKERVEKDLPPKVEQTIVLDMHPKERHLYEVYLQRERQKVLGLLKQGGFKTHRFEILTSLTRLRQLCLHPALVDAKHGHVPSAKLDAFMERLEVILSEGHRVVVFSQFTSFLAHAQKRLDEANLRYLYLDGATRNRKDVINAFQKERSVPLFLLSLKAGGFGLNLTAADYCVLLDPWWNPAVESQAIDRTHRIGQTRHVVVYRLIMRGTIEEKVVKLQEKKQGLFRNVLDEGDVFSTLLTEEDIRSIFA